MGNQSVWCFAHLSIFGMDKEKAAATLPKKGNDGLWEQGFYSASCSPVVAAWNE